MPLYWRYRRLESTALPALTAAVRAAAATALRQGRPPRVRRQLSGDR